MARSRPEALVERAAARGIDVLGADRPRHARGAARRASRRASGSACASFPPSSSRPAETATRCTCSGTSTSWCPSRSPRRSHGSSRCAERRNHAILERLDGARGAGRLGRRRPSRTGHGRPAAHRRGDGRGRSLRRSRRGLRALPRRRRARVRADRGADAGGGGVAGRRVGRCARARAPGAAAPARRTSWPTTSTGSSPPDCAASRPTVPSTTTRSARSLRDLRGAAGPRSDCRLGLPPPARDRQSRSRRDGARAGRLRPARGPRPMTGACAPSASPG